MYISNIIKQEMFFSKIGNIHGRFLHANVISPNRMQTYLSILYPTRPLPAKNSCIVQGASERSTYFRAIILLSFRWNTQYLSVFIFRTIILIKPKHIILRVQLFMYTIYMLHYNISTYYIIKKLSTLFTFIFNNLERRNYWSRKRNFPSSLCYKHILSI